MPFDMGFDCRNSSGYVTDSAYAVPTLGETYPNTYTNGNGDSINGGWVSNPGTFGMADRASGNDPRIAGINYFASVNVPGYIFTVDLSSGSAPGAGSYLIDVAMGDASFGNHQNFQVKDSSTVLIDGTNGGSGYATASGHYIDATLTDVAATTTWTGTQVSQTFATTTCTVPLNPTSGATAAQTMAHFRLTLVEATFQSAWATAANALILPGAP